MVSSFLNLTLPLQSFVLLQSLIYSLMIIDFIPPTQRKPTSFFPKLASKVLRKQRQIIKTHDKQSFYTYKEIPENNIYRMTANNILVNFQFDKRQRQVKPQSVTEQLNVQQNTLKKFRTTFIRKSSEFTQCCVDKKKIGKYSVVRQIGKGGFAQVYQVTDDSGKVFALKQYNLVNSIQCYYNQFFVGNKFFQNGNIKSQFANQKGVQGIIKFFQKWKNGKKGYIVQQIGGTNLSKLLSQIQGTFHNNQRVYQVKFNPFYFKLAQKQIFKNLLLQICQSVKCMNSAGLTHCDLKLENIMIKTDDQLNPIVKIIDFGSTFQSKRGLPKITITPEYMPPQLLSMFQNDKNQQDFLHKVDVWSIGCVLLQILTGVPLWFRYKCKLQIKGKIVVQLGIFAMTNRNYGKIIKKQKQLCEKLDTISFVFKEFQVFRPILKKILKFNHYNRVSIQQLINEINLIK